ncbi:MAG TPA: OsmC family protein, partial [Tabrizicola sp.]
MQYQLTARRLDPSGSLAASHGAEVRLATDMEGRTDALNPVELLLSALAACMIKGAERVIPTLKFQLDGMTVALEADRQDSPPKLTAIRYRITVTTPESDARIDLLH